MADWYSYNGYTEIKYSYLNSEFLSFTTTSIPNYTYYCSSSGKTFYSYDWLVGRKKLQLNPCIEVL